MNKFEIKLLILLTMLLHCDCNILVIGVFCLADRRFDYIGSFSQNLTNLM